jgi:hypothetical protein
MNILNLTDQEIVQIADPIWDDIVQGANEKNWDLFSKYMPADHATDEVRKNVEQQWENNPVLTSLSTKREFLSILRKADCVLVLWKQLSTQAEGEFLAMLYLKSLDSKVKSIGIWIR